MKKLMLALPYLVPVGAVVAGVYVVKKLIDNIGFFHSNTDTLASAAVEDKKGSASAFSPAFVQNYVKSHTGVKLLTSSSVVGICNDISTLGNFLHQFPGVSQGSKYLGKFKLLKNQVQVSQVAEMFQKLHHEDLLSFLRDRLASGDLLSSSDDQKYFQQILSYVNSLPIN